LTIVIFLPRVAKLETSVSSLLGVDARGPSRRVVRRPSSNTVLLERSARGDDPAQQGSAGAHSEARERDER
jgi:hypothetical protein